MPRQTTFDDGRGWHQESRRHHDAALKGMGGRELHAPVNATRPTAERAPARKQRVQVGQTITNFGGGQFRVLKVRESKDYGTYATIGYEDGLPNEVPLHQILAVDGEWIVPEDNQLRRLLEKDNFRPSKLPEVTVERTENRVELPPLKEGESYQVVQLGAGGGLVKGWARTTDPEKAVKEMSNAQLVLRTVGETGNFEIIPARSLDDAREMVRNRGKSDFLITGDTYDQRHELKRYGLKWDHASHGYRGKLTPKQAEEIQAREGLKVEASAEFTYDEQREARILKAEAKAEKYQGWAQNAERRGEERLDAAHKLGEQIPFGQPILVGHHSEKHARADAERIENNTRKGFEELKKADRYESRAEGVVAQAMRTRGSAGAKREEVRARKRAQIKEGTKIKHIVFGPGTVIKTNAKTMKVEFDSKAGGGAKYRPNIDYADGYTIDG